MSDPRPTFPPLAMPQPVIDPTDDASVYNAIIQTAEEHGKDSDPEMEIGDLQEALSKAIELLTPNQREALIGHLAADTFSGYWE